MTQNIFFDLIDYQIEIRLDLQNVPLDVKDYFFFFIDESVRLINGK